MLEIMYMQYCSRSTRLRSGISEVYQIFSNKNDKLTQSCISVGLASQTVDQHLHNVLTMSLAWDSTTMSVQSCASCSSWLWTMPCPLTRYEIRCDEMCDILSFQGHQLMRCQYSIYSETPVDVQCIQPCLCLLQKVCCLCHYTIFNTSLTT